MIQRRVPPAVALALIATLCGSGCLGGARNAPIRYWVLNALPGSPEPDGARRIVGVGPIRIPDHLRQSGIVLREGENELRVSTLDQWGEPLANGILRVIGENLSVLSPGLESVTFPWLGPVEPDLQISIAIARFDARRGGEVQLVASWLITRPADDADLATGSTRLSEPVAGDEIADVVAAMSRILQHFSRELLADIDAATAEAG